MQLRQVGLPTLPGNHRLEHLLENRGLGGEVAHEWVSISGMRNMVVAMRMARSPPQINAAAARNMEMRMTGFFIYEIMLVPIESSI